jgi:hypothetical protein
MAVGFAVGVERAFSRLLMVSRGVRAATRTVKRVAEMRRGSEWEGSRAVSDSA